jgi:uroporphyrinogen-III decarboxylase
MTCRERAELAMRGEQSDRVPVVPLVDTSYAAACYGVPVSECFLNPETHARSLVHVLERHPGIDGVSINIGLSAGVIARRSATASDHFVTTVDGTEWQIPMNDIGTPVSHAIQAFDDPRIGTLDVLRPHIVETLRAIPADVLRDYDISAGLTGPFSQIAFLMGVERVLLAMHEEPEALKGATEKRVRLALDWAEEMAELGAPSVWIGEGVASSSLISPRQYEEFVLPYEQRVAARLRELGVPSVLHICGKATRMLESMARSGCDCFEADWQVDLSEAKAAFGGRMSIKGNLHTTALVHDEPQQVFEAARDAIQKAKGGGGFILSSGCALGRDTPPANVEAMARAAREFGGY